MTDWSSIPLRPPGTTDGVRKIRRAGWCRIRHQLRAHRGGSMTTPTPASGSGPADTNLKLQGDIGDAAVPVAPAPEDDSTSARSSRRWLRPALSGLVSVAIVVVVFWYFVPQYTSVSDIWSSIQAMTWLELTTLVLAAIWNLATYGWVVMTTTPGLTYPQAEV